MTNKEKLERKKVRDDLCEKGVLPQRKPRLNRKAYAAQVLDEWKTFSVSNPDCRVALLEAILYMIPERSPLLSVSPEQLGVLKMLQIAMGITDYRKKAAAEGREINHLELWQEVVRPIWDL